MSAFIQKKHCAYLEMHLAVLLYGLTAILGALISVAAISLVWWRVGMTALAMIFFSRIFREIRKLNQRQLLTFLIIGGLIGIHWVCFYGSIKLANASVALICMSTISVFTAFIEPFFIKARLQMVDVLFGLAIIPPMWFTVHNLDFSMYSGVAVGILASVFLALFAAMNKKYIDKADPITITFIEMVGAWLFLSLFLPWILTDEKISFLPIAQDWIYLIFLSLVCTTFAFLLNLRALKHISAFASNYVFNLESVYGILLAIVILKEHKELNMGFYLGVLSIIVLVFLYPLCKERMK